MSYTLRGRFESRLAASVLPLLIALVLSPLQREWWPLELVGCMIAVGLVLDLVVYDRFEYQPGWAALPLGVLELILTMALARVLSVDPPLWPALAIFASSWVVAQLLTHAVLPSRRLTYAEESGELGHSGRALAAVGAVVTLATLGAAWSMQPPTYRLARGIHDGPLVLASAQRLIGEPGAVVEGGIVITADDIVVRNVTVRGGDHGIEVDGADAVVLDGVEVEGAKLDGINVRRSSVEIRDCEIRSRSGAYIQGIDISFGFDLAPSLVEGCSVTGGLEGIVVHFARVMVRENRVSETELRAITMTEMSDGSVEKNDIDGAQGVGIFCGDYSRCVVDENAVSNVSADTGSDDRTRQGVAIQSHFWATIELGENTVHSSPKAVGAALGGTIEGK